MLDKRKMLVTIWRHDITQARATHYAKYIAMVALLPNRVAFLDRTKMKVARPGGHNYSQRIVYWTQKNFVL